jgi:hypothetical protein
LKEEIEGNQPREESSDCLGSVEDEPLGPVGKGMVPRANGPDIDRRPWEGESFDGDSEREVDEFLKGDLLRRPLFHSFWVRSVNGLRRFVVVHEAAAGLSAAEVDVALASVVAFGEGEKDTDVGVDEQWIVDGTWESSERPFPIPLSIPSESFGFNRALGVIISANGSIPSKSQYP